MSRLRCTKRVRVGARTRRHLAHDEPLGRDPVEQRLVAPRVGPVDAAGQDGDRGAAGGEGSGVGGGVDAVRRAGHDGDAQFGAAPGELGSDP